MLKIKLKFPYLFITALLFLVELLSFLAHFYPVLQLYFLLAIFIIVLIVSLKSLETGILILLIELIIGSKGHLFSANLFGISLSLRLIIFLALMIASFAFLLRNNFKKIYLEKIKVYKFWPLLIALVFFIFLAAINGFLSGNNFNDLFHDLNAWLFIPIILPFILVYLPKPEKIQIKRLKKIFFIAIIFLSFKSLFFLYAFSHNLAFVPDLYLWIRRSGIGEITSMGGGYNRIFIQSQVYLAIAIFLILFKAIAIKDNKYFNICYLLLLSLFSSGLILSMSRSFWLAILTSTLIAMIAIFKTDFKAYLKALSYLFLSLLMSLALISAVTKFPFPSSQKVSLAALGERLEINNSEAATASRWALLPKLTEKILARPFTGSGFGTTISYQSQDPRVLAQNPDGNYTSYAFEWSYLDTLLKLGIFGFLVFILLITQILLSLWNKAKHLKSTTLLAVTASLLFFLIVNIFTPYLNHPLGLAFLLFSSCFVKKNTI